MARWAGPRSVETGALSLTAGEHEFEALGFESCCDGEILLIF